MSKMAMGRLTIARKDRYPGGVYQLLKPDDRTGLLPASNLALMMLEILNFPFVLFGIVERIESAQIPAFMRFRVNLPGVDAVFTRF